MKNFILNGQNCRNQKKNEYSSFNLKNNLYITKNYNNLFGIIFSDTRATVNMRYNYLEIDYKSSLSGKKSNLQNCLIITLKDSLDIKLFLAIVCTYIDYSKENHYSSIDIQKFLKDLELVISKDKKIKKQEVIGAWGELFFLQELLIKSSKNKYFEIISSWEGDNNRTHIDFTLKNNKKSFEIKTTTNSHRIHSFKGLEQLTTPHSITGYVVSICLLDYDAGQSCFDIYNNIYKLLNTQEDKNLFDKKILLRGKCTKNKNYKFMINKIKPIKFFLFETIPSPEISEGIIKVQWDVSLENINNDNSVILKNIID